MKKVTLDTNEFISAFNFRGTSLELIHMAIAGEIEIAVSKPILDETIRVLRQDFGWEPYRLHDLRQRLEKICRVVDPKERLAVVADEADNRILECAEEAGSECIVTEDKHLLRIGQYAGIKMMTIGDFLRRGQAR